MSATAALPSAFDSIRSHKTIMGHPAGLFVLFFTEMWERFSYYGMRALLVLYMVDYLIKGIQTGTYQVMGFAGLQRAIEWAFGPLTIQPLASQIYGMYTALAYFTGFFGGIIADRLLGQRKTVFIGGTLMAIGQFILSWESLFLFGLVFLIVGNGCFKPNLTSQVGLLYQDGDPRRDRAYSIYYVGVNLGAFLAPLICGTLGQKYGWKYGFQAAGVGMLVGLVVYTLGAKFLPKDHLTRSKENNAEKVPLTRKEWKVIWGLAVLVLLNAVFWGVYEQQGNTIQIFADRNADWHIFGWEMPSTWFQAVNPVFIFALTPLLTSFWNWQSLRKKEPGSIVKMALGCVCLGLSFIPLIWITRGLGENQRISFLWLVGCTSLYTLGELYLSPIGYSLVTKVAPPRLLGMLMGMWFLANFMGNYLTGYLGTFYEKMSRDSFFLLLTVLGVASGFAIFLFSKPLKNAVGRDT